MSLIELRGIWWLLLLLGPLLFLQRRVHREIQAIILLATHRPDLSITIFSILFMPGILLHEGSHFVMARLMGVRTGRFSIIPQATGDGRLQLGFVETSQTDPVRDAFIGLAPLVSGSLFVAYAGLSQLGLAAYWDSLAQMDVTFRSVFAAWQTTDDFWLWFYLVFVISSTMMPSAADRRAWLPLVIFITGLLGISLLFGAGPWMMENLAPAFDKALLALAVVLGISVGVHLVLWLPLWVVRLVLARLTAYAVSV